MSPFIFLALGLLLIFFEFYLPGAVLGISGTILVLVSIFLFASEFNSPILTILYILGTGVCIVFLFKFTLKRIVKAKPEYSIYSNDDQKNYFASSYDKAAIGKKGIVLADLKPGGYITVDGKQHQAISLTGYLAKGTEVIVVSGDGESLLVKVVTSNE